jgi:hypothetical protein
MAKAASTGVLVARESFVCEHDGQPCDIRAGDLFEADHPIVRRFPDHFEQPRFRFPTGRVEQATAAPGEKRGR